MVLTVIWLTGLRGLMNALFYFDCWGHKELKNIVFDGLWEPYAVTVSRMDGSYPSNDYDC